MIGARPEVSVCIFTYNHERYIEQCIESVLMQKTSFDYEIIIGEDYSDDRTKILCSKYAKIYPGMIKLPDRGRNLGMCGNVFGSLRLCSGKYIAIIDGDDFWIHPRKLQKQYDYLEANPNVNLVFHQAILLDEVTNRIDLFTKSTKDKYHFKDILNEWIIPTASMFFRKDAMDYPEFLNHTHNFDLSIQLIVNRNGSDIGYLPEVMSIYRINSGSNTYNSNYNSLNTLKRLLLLYREYNEYSAFKYTDLIQDKIQVINSKLQKLSSTKNSKSFKRVIKDLLETCGYKIIRTR